MMIISIITITTNAVISDVAKQMLWQKYLLSHPLYSYIIWHIMLFAVVFAVFYDSRHGFRNAINFFTGAFYWYKRSSKKNAIDYAVLKYKERSEKVYLSSVLLAVGVTIAIALVLYSEFIFFSVVVSDSMKPALQKGDLAFMQNIIVQPGVGDIITFKVPDERLPITHRIVSISGNEIRTKGDMNPVEDSWRVTGDQIMGKAVYVFGKPVVLKNLGNYFLVDASEGGRTYGPEFNAVSRLVRWIKSAGVMIFFICITLYLVLSIRDARRTRWY